MESLLAIDVGGGTQDILLYESGKPLENCIQMVLPSPTLLVAQEIKNARELGRPVFLYGHVMGGGPSVRAIKEHIAAGLPVYATAESAPTIHDNSEKVRELGVIIAEEKPKDAVAVRLGDLDVNRLEIILSTVGYPFPRHIAVAVQDHGFSPLESNRIFRFRMWERFMDSGGKLSELAYRDVPGVFSRMLAVKRDAPDALLMDTCGAALLGALTDQHVKTAAESGIVAVINLGNQHSFAALVKQDRVLGLFEHHTGMMTEEKAICYLRKLCDGTLTSREVQDDGGHGCIPPEEPVKPDLVVVTGPRRALLSSSGYYLAAPQGNMMLMGCFGLVDAAKSYWAT
jgi:uncharacterized protein (DUF1786 family)